MLLFIITFLSNSVIPGFLIIEETDRVEFFEVGEEGENENQEENQLDDFLAHDELENHSDIEFAASKVYNRCPKTLWASENPTPPPEQV